MDQSLEFAVFLGACVAYSYRSTGWGRGELILRKSTLDRVLEAAGISVSEEQLCAARVSHTSMFHVKTAITLAAYGIDDGALERTMASLYSRSASLDLSVNRLYATLNEDWSDVNCGDTIDPGGSCEGLELCEQTLLQRVLRSRESGPAKLAAVRFLLERGANVNLENYSTALVTSTHGFSPPYDQHDLVEKTRCSIQQIWNDTRTFELRESPSAGTLLREVLAAGARPSRKLTATLGTFQGRNNPNWSLSFGSTWLKKYGFDKWLHPDEEASVLALVMLHNRNDTLFHLLSRDIITLLVRIVLDMDNLTPPQLEPKDWLGGGKWHPMKILNTDFRRPPGASRSKRRYLIRLKSTKGDAAQSYVYREQLLPLYDALVLPYEKKRGYTNH